MTKTLYQPMYRVISETRTDYLLQDRHANTINRLSKKPHQEALYVGDWVSYNENTNDWQLSQRHHVISKASNRTLKNEHHKPSTQVMATNVDQVFIFIAVDQQFSLAKIERYFLVFYQPDIELYLVITKIDLQLHDRAIIDDIKKLYPEITLLTLHNFDLQSVKSLTAHFHPNQTGLLLGHSGSGKSTFINQLFPEQQQRTNQVRNDGKGKHTTTSSHLLYCERHSYSIIDTPGFKGIDKVQPIDLAPLFADILDLAHHCHFSNCTHQNEKGCAIQAALKSGQLNHQKWERYSYHHIKTR